MAVDTVTTSSSTGVDGNAYTTSVSNDTLTNEDFLTLMLAEMEQQDPTDPTDTSTLIDNQLQLSTIQANLDMTTALASLETSYANSALSNAASLIGYTVEDGTTSEDGTANSYKVESVESLNGSLYVQAKQVTGIVDGLKDTTDNDSLVLYDSNGLITGTTYSVSLDSDGRFEYNSDGTLIIQDEDGTNVTDSSDTDNYDSSIAAQYAWAGSGIRYSDTTTTIPFTSINEVQEG